MAENTVYFQDLRYSEGRGPLPDLDMASTQSRQLHRCKQSEIWISSAQSKEMAILSWMRIWVLDRWTIAVLEKIWVQLSPASSAGGSVFVGAGIFWLCGTSFQFWVHYKELYELHFFHIRLNKWSWFQNMWSLKNRNWFAFGVLADGQTSKYADVISFLVSFVRDQPQ